MTPLVIQYHASRTVAAQPAQHRPHNIVGAAAPAACMALPEQGRPEPRLFSKKSRDIRAGYSACLEKHKVGNSSRSRKLAVKERPLAAEPL